MSPEKEDPYVYENYFYYNGVWKSNLVQILTDSIANIKKISQRLNIQIKQNFYIIGHDDNWIVKVCRSFLALGEIFTIASLWIVVFPILLVFILCFTLAFVVVFLADTTVSGLLMLAVKAYLKARGFYILCRYCDRKVLNPIYICPTCRAEHQLMPSHRYGVLYWKCSCGKRLVTTRLFRFAKYDAICQHDDCRHGLNWQDENVVPKLIAIIGGTFSGKTLFLNALVNHLWTTYPNDFAPVSQEKDGYWIETCNENIANGHRPSKTTAEHFTRPNCLFHPKTRTRYYFFDQAGEQLEDFDSQTRERYLTLVDTIVFVVDPFSLKELRYKYTDYAGEEQYLPQVHSLTDPNGNLNILGMILKGVYPQNRKHIRCAIVITKIDCPHFTEKTGLSARSSSEDCKRFLKTFGAQNFTSQIDMYFPERNQYFAMSLTGHSEFQEGQEFKPEGLEPCVKWLFSRS